MDILKEDYQKTLESKLNFFLYSQSLFMDKIIKKQEGMKLVSSFSLGCKPCLEKSL